MSWEISIQRKSDTALVLRRNLGHQKYRNRTGIFNIKLLPILNTGNYFELAWAAVSPDLNGSRGLLDPAGLGTCDILESFDVGVVSLKTDLTPRTSLALVLDQPFGSFGAKDHRPIRLGLLSPLPPMADQVLPTRQIGYL